MSFEIQDLPDVIKVITLINLSKGIKLEKSVIKKKIDHICVNHACIDTSEFDKALKEMATENLIEEKHNTFT